MDIPAMPENWNKMTDAERAEFMQKNTTLTAPTSTTTLPKKYAEDLKNVKSDAPLTKEQEETAQNLKDIELKNALAEYDKAVTTAPNDTTVKSVFQRFRRWLDKEAERFQPDANKSSMAEDEEKKKTKLDYSVPEITDSAVSTAPAKASKTAPAKKDGKAEPKEETHANETAQGAVIASAGVNKGAAKAAASTLRPEEAMLAGKELSEALGRASKTIDTGMLENIPKTITMRYRNGEFTAGGKMQDYQRAKDELSELKNKLGDEKLGSESRAQLKEQIAEKEKEISDIKSSKEFKEGRRLYTYLMLNSLGTKAINAYSILKGGGAIAESAGQKINRSRLEGALDRYNQKYADIAKNEAELLYTDAKEQQDARIRINRWLTDAALRPYVQQLTLDDKKRLLDWEKKMGRSITAEDIAALSKYQLFGNESTGENVKGTIGGVVNTVKSFL